MTSDSPTRETDRTPSVSPAQVRLLLLTFALVSLTTWALLELQNVLRVREHAVHVRPFTIGYVLPLFVITMLGGRWFGRLALALSVALTAGVLAQPEFSLAAMRPRVLVEIGCLLIVGEALVRGLDYFRRDMAMREDVEQSPFTARLLTQAKDAAQQVPGVQGVGPCTFRRRGIEYFVDVDIFVSDSLPMRDADRLAAQVQDAVTGVYQFISAVRVRLRTWDSAVK